MCMTTTTPTDSLKRSYCCCISSCCDAVVTSRCSKRARRRSLVDEETKKVRSVCFADVVEAKEAQFNSKHLTQEQIDSMWFSKNELKAIRKETRSIIRQHQEEQQTTADGNCGFTNQNGDCMRGLEKRMDWERQMTKEGFILKVLEFQDDIIRNQKNHVYSSTSVVGSFPSDAPHGTNTNTSNTLVDEEIHTFSQRHSACDLARGVLQALVDAIDANQIYKETIDPTTVDRVYRWSD